MNKRIVKITGSLIIAIVSLGLLSVGTFSFFHANSTNKITTATGDVDVKINEISPYNGYLSYSDDSVWSPSEDKIFSVVSDGSKETYARVAITPTVEYYNEENKNWETCGFVSSDNIKYNLNNENWLQSDNFYYYKAILNKNDVSSEFRISNIQVDMSSVLENIVYSSYNYRISFNVSCEGCQASNETYKLTWGKDTILPDGIEKPAGDDSVN